MKNKDYLDFLYNYKESIERCIHQENEIQKKDKAFNIFELIADKYKHENFHSDILAFILDPTEKHNAKDEYLNLFIEFLNSISNTNKEININIDHYKNSQVSREENRIDILIKDKQSKHAIIIENKINDAVDMHLQLPRYVEQILTQKYEIDAILYLSKDGNKTPSRNDWKENVEENIIKIIDEKMISLASFTSIHSTNNLVTGWLKPSIKKAIEKKSNEIELILTHYSNLLQKLNIMTEISQEEKFLFDSIIKDPKNYENAFQIKKLLENRLAVFLSNDFKEKFEKKYPNYSAPFEKLTLAPDAICQVLFSNWDYKESKYYLRIQFDINNKNFEIVLRDRNNNNTLNEKESDLEQIGFKKDGYGYFQHRYFSVNPHKEDESLDALVIYIHDTILQKLNIFKEISPINSKVII